jgi:type VI protein secretion system component VasA
VVALVLTFKWPANSINQAYSSLRGATLLESLQAPPGQQGPSQRAQKHWRLIRTLCVEYVRAHRCGS